MIQGKWIKTEQKQNSPIIIGFTKLKTKLLFEINNAPPIDVMEQLLITTIHCRELKIIHKRHTDLD